MANLNVLRFVATLCLCVTAASVPEKCNDTGDLCIIDAENCFMPMTDASGLKYWFEKRSWFVKLFNTFSREGSYTFQLSVAPPALKRPAFYNIVSKKGGKWKILEDCCDLRAELNESCVLGVPEANEKYYYTFPCGSCNMYFSYKIDMNPVPWCRDVKFDQRDVCMEISDNRIHTPDYPRQRIDIFLFTAPLSNVNISETDSFWQYSTIDISFNEQENEIHIGDKVVTPKIVERITDLTNLTMEKHSECEVSCFYAKARYTGLILTSKPVCYVPAEMYKDMPYCEDKTKEQRVMIGLIAGAVAGCLLIFSMVCLLRYGKSTWKYVHPPYDPGEVEEHIRIKIEVVPEEENRTLLQSEELAEEYVPIGQSSNVAESNNNIAIHDGCSRKNESPRNEADGSETGSLQASASEVNGEETVPKDIYGGGSRRQSDGEETVPKDIYGGASLRQSDGEETFPKDLYEDSTRRQGNEEEAIPNNLNRYVIPIRINKKETVPEYIRGSDAEPQCNGDEMVPNNIYDGYTPQAERHFSYDGYTPQEERPSPCDGYTPQVERHIPCSDDKLQNASSGSSGGEDSYSDDLSQNGNYNRLVNGILVQCDDEYNKADSRRADSDSEPFLPVIPDYVQQ